MHGVRLQCLAKSSCYLKRISSSTNSWTYDLLIDDGYFLSHVFNEKLSSKSLGREELLFAISASYAIDNSVERNPLIFQVKSK